MNKKIIKKLMPGFVWEGVKGAMHKTMDFCANALEYNYANRTDFSNPLPWLDSLRANKERWSKPSRMTGVAYDLDAIRSRFGRLIETYGREIAELPPYEVLLKQRRGWGCPRVDVLTLYMMIRDLKPKRYLEVGSGLTTYYAHLAAERNAKEGRPVELMCIEPYPSDELRAMPGVNLKVADQQSIDPSFFEQLEDGDVLFIDSSHVLKIDSDVAYLYLEVVPRVRQGVWVHVHDVPFPYNAPHPADFWVLSNERPAMFWTEAMMVQAFLCCNDSFRIQLSTPLLRHHDEAFLRRVIPSYKGIDEEPNTFSSLWMQRVRGG